MFKRLFVAALVFGAAATAPPPAEAQAVCGPRNDLTARLAEDYGESQRGLGLKGSAAVYELWVSEKTGSWTFIVSLPDGRACLVASGVHWHDVPRPEAVIGEPS